MTLDKAKELNAKSRLVICLSAADPHPQKVRDQYQLTLLAPLLDHYRGSQPF